MLIRRNAGGRTGLAFQILFQSFFHIDCRRNSCAFILTFPVLEISALEWTVKKRPFLVIFACFSSFSSVWKKISFQKIQTDTELFCHALFHHSQPFDIVLTEAQLAEAVGVSNNHISSVETGKVLPSLTLTIKISHALNTSIDYLAVGSVISDNSIRYFVEGIDRIPKSELTILKRIIDVFIESAGQIGREEN